MNISLDNKNKLNDIRSKMTEKLKNNKAINKETNSRDWESLVNTLDAIQGTKVRAIIKLAINEYAIVRPISTNNCLVIPSVNTIGKNTHIVVRVEEHIALETCFAPYTAASYLFAPLFLIL